MLFPHARIAQSDQLEHDINVTLALVAQFARVENVLDALAMNSRQSLQHISIARNPLATNAVAGTTDDGNHVQFTN